MASAIEKENDIPDDSGGFGYSPHQDPHPDCPECHGEGVGRQVFKDTRKLVGGARLLYAGMEQTKEGLKVRMHNQKEALDMVAKHIGMGREKLDINLNVTANVEELDAIYQRKMAESRERSAAVRNREPIIIENGNDR